MAFRSIVNILFKHMGRDKGHQGKIKTHHGGTETRRKAQKTSCNADEKKGPWLAQRSWAGAESSWFFSVPSCLRGRFWFVDQRESAAKDFFSSARNGSHCSGRGGAVNRLTSTNDSRETVRAGKMAS